MVGGNEVEFKNYSHYTEYSKNFYIRLQWGCNLSSALALSVLILLVFAAMFNPQFKEGIRFHRTPAPLPEDDARAFIFFFNVIHYRSDEIPQEPDISCLENLAFIYDKYYPTEKRMEELV